MRIQILVAALALALAPVSYAKAPPATLSPDLQAQIESGYQGSIRVIVKFSDGVDFKQLRKDVNRLLKQQYPDPKERKAARKALKQSELLKALRKASKGNAQAVAKYLRAKGAVSQVKELWIANAVAVEVPAGLIAGLAALPGVEEVYLDAEVQGPVTGTAPTAPTYWNLDMTGVSALWALGYTGGGVVVATMDTGADASHPDLGPRWRGGSNSWLDPYGQNPAPADSTGHGTQVLGLMVAGDAGGYQVGMAPDAQWIAAKIFDDSNTATLSAIHAAFQWVLDPDGNPATADAPDILNNSWVLNGTENQCVQEFALDIAALKEAEIAVVFAGGNYGPAPATSVAPANDPAAVSVGAVDYYENLYYKSSRGPGACDGGIYPHLAAPGAGVLTTDRMPGFYNIVSGTSFAAPHVSGGMAILMGAFPEATVSQIETALKDNAADLGESGADNDFGHGLIDLWAAYQQLDAELGDGGSDPGVFGFSMTDYSVDENVASLAVTVTRSGGSAGEVSVDFAADVDPGATDAATADADFGPMAETLVFADGETSRMVDVSIVDDDLTEADEDFRLSLSNPQGGATLGASAEAVATILDDDLPADEDGDGVGDALDQCPGTPAGATVDADGCSASQLDADADGVSDALDQCPGTPAGASVDADGCSASQLDGDADGVSDALDQCPATPAGESVDADGCSASQLDADGDGVSDALDQCPGTPSGTAVDEYGCALPVGPEDADGDGFTVDQDCDDADASVYPGATEIRNDGIDQDCDGYDLTINITKAAYQANQDKPVVLATSTLEGAAALTVTYHGAAGESLTRNMTWNAKMSRWQKAIRDFSSRFGFVPVSVTVAGPEGSATAPM